MHFSILAGSLRVFSVLRSSRSTRLLRFGAYTDCAEEWRVCWCMWILLAVGVCRPLGLGCGIGRSPPRDSDALSSPRVQKGHMRHNTLTESALHPRAHTCVARTHRATARVASLAHSPRRHVNE